MMLANGDWRLGRSVANRRLKGFKLSPDFQNDRAGDSVDDLPDAVGVEKNG